MSVKKVPPPTGPEDENDPVILQPDPPPRKQLSVAEQAERNMQIVEARLRNTPWPKIAARYSLTERRCFQIWEEWRDLNPTLREHDPITIVDELLYGYQGVIADLAEQVETSKHDAVRVGAQNAKLRAYREMAELLQAVGALPNDLGTLNLHIDGQITAERIVAVLERHHIPEDVFSEILDALGGPVKELESGEPGVPAVLDGDADAK